MHWTRIMLNAGKLVSYGFLIMVAFLVLFPVTWIIAQSFMREAQIYRWPITFIPEPLTLHNYANLFVYRPERPDLPIARWMFNSIFVATTVTVLVLTVASMAAYAFARFQFPGKNFFFYLFGASMLIPGQITFIPSFLIVRSFGWIDTYHALIWPPIADFLVFSFCASSS